MAAKAKGVPPFAAHLLDFIGDIEAPRGYDTVYGNNQGKLKKPITQMTIAEVQAAQAGWTKQFGSSATGRYQFMRETLKGLIAEQNLDVSAKFDERMQDRLGFVLLRRRGYDDFVAGKIGVTAFAKALAQEWASLPVLADTRGAHREVVRGQSYYAGDGLNKSLVSPERVEAALRVQLPGTVVAAPAKPAPKGPTGGEATAGGAIVAGGGAVVVAASEGWGWIEWSLAGLALLAVCVAAFFAWRWWKARKAKQQQAAASAEFDSDDRDAQIKSTGDASWTGGQSLASLPLSPQSSELSLEQLSAARLALSLAASQVAPSPPPSARKQPRKRSAKPSPKTRKRQTSSRVLKNSAAKKSSPKRKPKSRA